MKKHTPFILTLIGIAMFVAWGVRDVNRMGEYRHMTHAEKQTIDAFLNGRPWNGNAYELLADFHKAHGHWAEAADCYTKAIELGGGLFNPYQLRSECYEKLGRDEDARMDRLTAPNWNGEKGRLKTEEEVEGEVFSAAKAEGIKLYGNPRGKGFKIAPKPRNPLE